MNLNEFFDSRKEQAMKTEQLFELQKRLHEVVLLVTYIMEHTPPTDPSRASLKLISDSLALNVLRVVTLRRKETEYYA